MLAHADAGESRHARSMGDLDRAVVAARRGVGYADRVTATSSVLDSDVPSMATVYQELVLVERDVGDRSELRVAATASVQAAQIDVDQHPGRDLIDLARALGVLAKVLEEDGFVTEAADTCERGLLLLDRVDASPPPARAAVLSNASMDLALTAYRLAVRRGDRRQSRRWMRFAVSVAEDSIERLEHQGWSEEARPLRRRRDWQVTHRRI